MTKEQKRKEQTIRIGLPERHWIVLLAILDEVIHKNVKPGIEKLKKKGIKLTEITDEQATTLAGPLMIRGIIVKELISRGVMKPEAEKKLGIDKLFEAAEKFRIFPEKDS
jgi:hypothetical protein